MTNQESFKGFKIIITKCFKTLLENFQSVASITKLERIYYQAWQVLQSVAFITKRERRNKVLFKEKNYKNFKLSAFIMDPKQKFNKWFENFWSELFLLSKLPSEIYSKKTKKKIARDLAIFQRRNLRLLLVGRSYISYFHTAVSWKVDKIFHFKFVKKYCEVRPTLLLKMKIVTNIRSS